MYDSDGSGLKNVGAPAITKEEVERALKRMRRGKAAGEDGITVDLIKDGGLILPEKLAKIVYPLPQN